MFNATDLALAPLGLQAIGIVAELQRNGRVGTLDVARRLGVSQGTACTVLSRALDAGRLWRESEKGGWSTTPIIPGEGLALADRVARAVRELAGETGVKAAAVAATLGVSKSTAHQGLMEAEQAGLIQRATGRRVTKTGIDWKPVLTRDVGRPSKSRPAAGRPA